MVTMHHEEISALSKNKLPKQINKKATKNVEAVAWRCCIKKLFVNFFIEHLLPTPCKNVIVEFKII